MTSSTVKTKDGVEIFYKDWGPKGAQPIMFHHGWPLSSDDWDAQMLFFSRTAFGSLPMTGAARALPAGRGRPHDGQLCGGRLRRPPSIST